MITIWAEYGSRWYYELLAAGWIHFENFIDEHNLAKMVWRSHDTSK